MKVLVSGSTGLVGSALVPYLTQAGHNVIRLVRSKDQPGILWNPATNLLNSTPFEGFDAVVHLAGENIASGRWSEERKQRIRDSRVQGTKLLVNALTRLKEPPKTLICASAIGYYGNRGPQPIREDSAVGTGFLAELCRAWEAAAVPVAEKGTRVVNLRFGVILSKDGGALKMMLPPFKMGVGGKIGPGTQYMSWIALQDVLGVISFVLSTPSLKGPVNAVAPYPLTNLEFTKTLGRVLSRPTFLPLPAFIARLVFGEMADEMLLSSQRVEPKVLTDNKFSFRYPTLENALRAILTR